MSSSSDEDEIEKLMKDIDGSDSIGVEQVIKQKKGEKKVSFDMDSKTLANESSKQDMLSHNTNAYATRNELLSNSFTDENKSNKKKPQNDSLFDESDDIFNFNTKGEGGDDYLTSLMQGKSSSKEENVTSNKKLAINGSSLRKYSFDFLNDELNDFKSSKADILNNINKTSDLDKENYTEKKKPFIKFEENLDKDNPDHFEDFFSNSSRRKGRRTSILNTTEKLGSSTINTTEKRKINESSRLNEITKSKDLSMENSNRSVAKDADENKEKTKSNASNSDKDWLSNMLNNKFSSDEKASKVIVPINIENSENKTASDNNFTINSLPTSNLNLEIYGSLNSQIIEQQKVIKQLIEQQRHMNISKIDTELSIDDLKHLKVDLHRSNTEVEVLKVEMEMVKEQHSKELKMINYSNEKRFEFQEALWSKKEENFIQEKNDNNKNFNQKICDIQKQKDEIIADLQCRLNQSILEEKESVSRLQSENRKVIECLKTEHQEAIDRLIVIKDIEIKAALSATSNVPEVKTALNILESNTSNLSELSQNVNKSYESSVEYKKKILELKDKQLNDMENNVKILKTESENERNRLMVLVNRLEHVLLNQGIDVERQKWALEQETTKLNLQISVLNEEKNKFKNVVDIERQHLNEERNLIVEERKKLAEYVEKFRNEVEALEIRKLDSLENASESAHVQEIKIRDEKKELEKQRKSLETRSRKTDAKEEEIYKMTLENSSLKSQLEFKMSEYEESRRILDSEKNSLTVEKNNLEKTLLDVENKFKALHTERQSVENRIVEITDRETELRNRITDTMCIFCQSKNSRDVIGVPKSQLTGINYSDPCEKNFLNSHDLFLKFYSRIPGDFKEKFDTENNTNFKSKVSVLSFDPESVLNRLKLAKEEENKYIDYTDKYFSA